MNLKVILSSANAPIIASLKCLPQALPDGISTECYCLCEESEALKARNKCEEIKNNKTIFTYKIFTRHDFSSVASLANHFFLDDVDSGFLFFLSADVLVAKDCLKGMIDCLAADSQMAGVNLALRAGWFSDVEKRAGFMGIAFDFQKRMHFLYEGMLADSALARKKRFFQMGYPGCLLIRSADFRKAGGFNKDMGFLAFPALCLQILKLRSKGFTCLYESQGYLTNKFESWSFCGAWDSILQRGRLETKNIKSDYADFCQIDNIAYGCDSWLNEGPMQVPDLSAEPEERSWQEWRYHPRPTTLLTFLSALPVPERGEGVELVRNRPASLPQTLQYYKVQAEKLLALLEKRDSPLKAQIDLWLKKIRRFHYGELKPGINLLKKAGIYNCSLDVCPAIFDAWVEVSENFENLDIGGEWPEIAVIMPVWNPRPAFLEQAIESVISQTYPNWQLCIADDASTKEEIRPMLESFANNYKLIKVTFRQENGHICRASNTALEMVAAPFTAFLDHDDLLSPHALGEVASLIAKKPDLGFIYTDDDRINEDNVRRNPVFRPDFDCDLFHTGHLSTYSTRLLRELGGLRIGTEGSQDTDLRFRASEALDYEHIAHIPHILYHWRVHEESTAGSFLAKPYVIESGRMVYLEAAERLGRAAEWGDKASHRLYRMLYYPKKRCLCSIILMVEEKEPSELLLETIKRLEKYVDIEIYDQPLRAASPPARSRIALPYVGEKIAHACNEAGGKANGDILLFLSANLEPDFDCRLEQLVEMAMNPHIAMASGNIWHNERLVSGGWYPNADGLPLSLLEGMGRSEVRKSIWGQMFLPRHVIGAPWQCMAVKRDFFRAIQFFDENYGLFATVDFAIKAMRHGKFVAMNPWVNWRTLIMPSWPNNDEIKYLIDHRGAEIAACGLRNPNLRAAPDRDWTLIFQ